MPTFPRSAYDLTSGMAYFARMLDKIRLHHQGQLGEDYHDNLGRGADKFCLNFLRVSYEDVQAQVLQGRTDEEVLQWCFDNGWALNEANLAVWNAFILKFGWNDKAASVLDSFKAKSGLEHRDDIQTLPQYFEVDEGRR